MSGWSGVGVVHQVARFVHVLRRIRSPRRWYFHDRRTDHRSNLHVHGSLSDDFREEILIAEAGGTAANHFRYGELRSVSDHLGTDPALLNREDGLP